MALEPVSARVAPIEDGYDVLDTTIWPVESQAAVAQVLGVDASRSEPHLQHNFFFSSYFILLFS